MDDFRHAIVHDTRDSICSPTIQKEEPREQQDYMQMAINQNFEVSYHYVVQLQAKTYLRLMADVLLKEISNSTK